MATEPLTIDIIFQLMYISIGLVILGYILNWILGLKPEIMKEIRNNARNLQERLRQAQVLGDELLMFQLQQETMQLMKQMLKKQLAPMLIRCVIFLGIFAILSFNYGRYEYWFWVYFAFSLSFSLLAFGLRKLYLKITGKDTKKEKFTKELFDSFTKTQQELGSFHLSGQTEEIISNTSDSSKKSSDEIEEAESEEFQESGDSVSWKDRINN
ncbi:MAG: hypothetical protein EU532_09275 [Promethearchaeota archaeon]|nr:MAG: hypothetical protein EU532_09275 [Candidatus Lokiarchaeota archaeon]